MNKIREALVRGLDKTRHKERADAMYPITVNRWWRLWALDLETNAREALAELDKPPASDAQELAVNDFRMDELDAVMHSVDKWFDEGDPRLNNNPATRAADAREIALKAIEALADRECKAREETARKCAEAANEAISAYLDAAEMCDCGHLSVDRTGEFERLVERAILEAAK